MKMRRSTPQRERSPFAKNGPTDDRVGSACVKCDRPDVPFPTGRSGVSLTPPISSGMPEPTSTVACLRSIRPVIRRWRRGRAPRGAGALTSPSSPVARCSGRTGTGSRAPPITPAHRQLDLRPRHDHIDVRKRERTGQHHRGGNVGGTATVFITGARRSSRRSNPGRAGSCGQPDRDCAGMDGWGTSPPGCRLSSERTGPARLEERVPPDRHTDRHLDRPINDVRRRSPGSVDRRMAPGHPHRAPPTCPAPPNG